MKCPPCNGSGNESDLRGFVCKICRGIGDLPDDRINEPSCNSCNGSGRRFGLRGFYCEVCGGWGRNPLTGPQLPSQLAQSLDSFKFAVTKNHLAQAVDNVQRKQWESANGDLRAFLESLCEEKSLSMQSA